MTKTFINVVAPIGGMIGLLALTVLLILDARWVYVALPLCGGFFFLSSSYGYKGTSWGESCAGAGRVVLMLSLISLATAAFNWVQQ